MKRFFDKTFSPLQDIASFVLLRKLLFIYTIVNFLQLMPFVPELYSSDFSIIYQRELSAITLNSVFNLLAFDALKNLYWWFFGIQIFFSTLGFIGCFQRLSTFVVWFTTINLQNRIYSTNTGGDLLLNILLFYLIFISDSRKLKNVELEKLKNVFDFFFSKLCKVQISIVYFISALYKVISPEWLDGSALERILFVNEYSLPEISKIVSNYSLLFKLLTWLILAYQILFPMVLIKNNKTNYILIIGVTLHLAIALVMGLFNFSLIMIISYVLFIPTNHLKKIPLANFLISKK
jgi:hypothetical protein